MYIFRLTFACSSCHELVSASPVPTSLASLITADLLEVSHLMKTFSQTFSKQKKLSVHGYAFAIFFQSIALATL